MLRFRLLPATITGASVLAASFAIAYSTGPDASKSGAPSIAGRSAEVTCQSCHLSFMGPNLNVNGQLEILDLPASYQPAGLYTLRVRLASGQTVASPGRKWGFQITAIELDTGDGAGTFVLPDPDTLQIKTGELPGFETRRYVEHTELATRDSLAGPVEWTFQWQAPDSLIGPIGFYATGNAANGDGGQINGDWIYTARDTTEPDMVPVRPASWGALKARYR
jgi:hypothetical protein